MMMPTKTDNLIFKGLFIWKSMREAIINFLIQHFEADFLWPQNSELEINHENFLSPMITIYIVFT